MKNSNNINNNKGGEMNAYTRYITESGDIIYIYNGYTLFNHIGIEFIKAANAVNLDSNWIPISTHVAIAAGDINKALDIFGTIPILGTYGKKAAAGGTAIIEATVGGIFDGDNYKGYDGGGWIGYDFCEKYNISKTALTQLFVIKKDGGFAKGAFMPKKGINGIWFGPGTIKYGIFKPGDTIVVNIFRTTGKHYMNESFENVIWFKDSTPWIKYYDEYINKMLSGDFTYKILNIHDEDEQKDEVNTRAHALLKISPSFVHHKYIRNILERNVLYMFRKYSTSGGRRAIAYPLVADNSVPRGSIIICDNSYKPGTIVTGFRYPVLQKNGCREWIVIKNNGPYGEWIRINPEDARQHIQADFDIDTMAIMKHRPGVEVGYISGFDNMVKEFPAVEQHFGIDELRDRIAKKQQTLIGKATIFLAAAVEAGKEKDAEKIATVIQQQVDSLKKIIPLPDEYKKMEEYIRKTNISDVIPNWWKVRINLKTLNQFKKTKITVENTPTGRLVAHVFNSIVNIIDKLPEVYDNSTFSDMFGNGIPMTDQELKVINKFYNTMRIAISIKDNIERQNALKYLAIEIDNFAQKVGKEKVIWYWNKYHKISNGNATIPVWLLTSVLKDEVKYVATKIIKFNINYKDSLPTEESTGCISDMKLMIEKNVWNIYSDQQKYIQGLRTIRITKVVKLSNTSAAIYCVPTDNNDDENNDNNKNIKGGIMRKNETNKGGNMRFLYGTEYITLDQIIKSDNIIISASRRNDIALRQDIRALLAHIMKNNPTAKGWVWTKNPFFMEKDAWVEFYNRLIIGLTITGLGGTVIEPHVPGWQTIIETLKRIIDKGFNPDNIDWRFDPIIKSKDQISSFETIASAVSNLGIKRCRISFISIYGKLAERFKEVDIAYTKDQQIEVVEYIKHIADNYGITLYGCSQPHLAGIIEKSHCIDGSRFGLDLQKDPSQRADCGCSLSVDIGDYSECGHGCVYCYAHPKPHYDIDKIKEFIEKKEVKMNKITTIYCDAGKRGGANNTDPTRIRVTDQNGHDILDKANAIYNGHRVYEFKDLTVTNNFGELVALTIAMRLAIEHGVKMIKTDSNVAIWWVQGKGKELKKYWNYYEQHTKPYYEKFINNGGQIIKISGDVNKADLEDHI